ncbi:hypothetical protein FFLO_05820 [Filobasidium floriforme]|uniref:NADP-dependent oxidoreductase domain-containing protein n=1 Tax=Filobasidium floriforme TaxID=5210 RepID=A0A8K0JLQ1_9TREE|nr:hypothetical protein FFLO_05820 [Filobasidium floriforme]
MTTKTASLNTGAEIPLVGLGCWMLKRVEADNPATYQMVRDALDVGYRHLDTADGYGNEQAVGKAVRDSGVPRKDIFVTTKLNNLDHGDVKAGFERNLKALDIEYIDLYLMHWPQAVDPDTGKTVPFGTSPTFVETWKQMEQLIGDGRCKAIGVSNFSVRNLETLLAEAKIVPAVNQVEAHPYLPQQGLDKLCREKGIHMTAYSPLGRPTADKPSPLMTDALVTKLSEKYNKTPGAVLLSWLVQRGNWSVVPKSANPERMKANLDIFELETADFDALSKVHTEPGKLRHLLKYDQPEDVMKSKKVFEWSLQDMGWEQMD